MAAKPERLRPARPEVVDDAAGYMPRIAWRFVLLGAVSLAAVIGGYKWKERVKADEVRAAIVRVHEEELGEARSAYKALRDKVERLVLSAAQARPDTLVDPRLHLPGLRSGHGLYLRLQLTDAQTKQGIENGAKVMEPDMIASCMGLLPPSARGLYEKGVVLTDAWLAQAKRQTQVMHLRVQEEVLSRHIRADLPSVLGLTRSDWLMLVLQEGKDRRNFPVRVFLWDLRRDQPLLQARVQSQGALISTRVLSKDAPYSPKLSEEAKSGSGAADCSIASQLKQLTQKPEEQPLVAPTAAPAAPLDAQTKTTQARGADAPTPASSP